MEVTNKLITSLLKKFDALEKRRAALDKDERELSATVSKVAQQARKDARLRLSTVAPRAGMSIPHLWSLENNHARWETHKFTAVLAACNADGYASLPTSKKEVVR